MDNFRKENLREGASTNAKNTFIREVSRMERKMEKGIYQSAVKA